MEWLVFKENMNSKKLEPYNIFDNKNFEKDCRAAFESSINEDGFIEYGCLEDKLSRILRYYFWGKTEYEFYFGERKISIYDQVVREMKAFIDFLKEEWLN